MMSTGVMNEPKHLPSRSGFFETVLSHDMYHKIPPCRICS